MNEKFDPLPSKEVKLFCDILEANYGYTEEWNYFVFMNRTERKVSVIHKDCAEVALERIRINSLGLYIGQLNDDQTEIRLSIDGSQIIGPYATKNVLQLTQEEFSMWIQGGDLEVTDSLKERLQSVSGYIIIQNPQGDFFGTAREKNGVLLNFIPKNRRIKNVA